MAGLMQRAKQAQPAGERFKKPDITQFVPANLHDPIARIVAAGMRLITAPQLREQVQADIQRNAPVPQKLAESTLGLMLQLDQQTKGGLPQEALLPAGLALLGEAADILTEAGQVVTQEDYNEAARMLFVGMSRKLGMNDDDIMAVAEKAVGQAGGQPADAGQPVDDGQQQPPAPTDAAQRDAADQAAWDEETQ